METSEGQENIFVAPHERRHYIFIRFWKVPMEAAILFAGSSQIISSLSLLVLMIVRYLIDYNRSKSVIDEGDKWDI